MSDLRRVQFASEAVGLACIVVAAFLISHVVGLAVLGLVLVALGNLTL